MRAFVYAIVAAICLAYPAFAQADRTALSFWRAVQANCDATAAKSPTELGQHIAQTAINEFTSFGGHRIDSNGRLFKFGLTAAEHNEPDGSDQHLGDLGWRHVMKYWQALYGDDAGDKIESRGYRDASISTDDAQGKTLLRADAAQLLRAVKDVSDPAMREILREAVIRAAIMDTPWSAAFVSYVIRQSGVAADAFHFANAHRVYIYDAVATSAAELTIGGGDRLYRACPLSTTKPRTGDLICFQREAALADASEEVVRERIRADLNSGPEVRSVGRTHCEVVAYIDAPARKMYSIGGNVLNSVAARKLNLRHDLKLAAVQRDNCGGSSNWTLSQPAGHPQRGPSRTERCSLSDKKWFVLLQLR